jgi:hypothetical protein
MILQDVQKDRPARPQRAKGRGVRGWYVEALSDARTTLEGFFNILPGAPQPPPAPATARRHWAEPAHGYTQ